MTKADGSFELPVSGNCETIFFWNERFKPFSEPTRGHTQEPFDVIIDPVANSQWKIPRCSEVKDSKYYIGVGTHLRVKLPDTITFRTESYGGLTYYQLRFETAPQKWDWMLLTSEAPSGLHKEILLDGRADQRTWDSHGTLGIERRFGNYRLVTEAYGNSYIESKPESSKGTEIFNAIIDTVCNEPVAERSYSTGRGMIRIRTFKSGSGNGWLPRSRLQLTPQTYGRAEPYEYEAYTDEKGRFSFKDLPPGVYRLKISSLHEKYQRTLTVRPGRVQTHTFKVSPVTMKDVEKLQRSLTPAGNCPNC